MKTKKLISRTICFFQFEIFLSQSRKTLDVAKVRNDLIHKKSKIESYYERIYFKSYFFLKYVFICTYLFLAAFYLDVFIRVAKVVTVQNDLLTQIENIIYFLCNNHFLSIKLKIYVNFQKNISPKMGLILCSLIYKSFFP